MIKKEYLGVRSDGVGLYKTYSDLNLKIKKLGTDEIYNEAVDVENSKFEYFEIEEYIETDDYGKQEN